MVRELELVVAGEFLDVASVLVLLVTIIPVPVVLLYRCSPFVDVIAGSLVAFKQSTF